MATPTTMKLLELAAKRFDTILPAEQKLFDAAADGKDADCTGLPAKDRVIRGDRLCWLCTNPDASAQVTYRGVSILGAEIDGELDLEWAKISFPLRIRKCVFKNAIILQNSHLVSLDLADSSIKDLRAENLIVERSVVVSGGFECDGGVNLVAATIGGNLVCDGGQFVSKSEEPALKASGAKIQGNVFLGTGFRAEGGVNLLSARIGGDLVCDNGQFISKSEEPALQANGANIEKSVALHQGFNAEGGVSLTGARIGGDLACDGGQFVNKGEEPALRANGAKIEGNVILRQGFNAEGGVDFGAARIGGNLECDSGRFVSKSEAPALNADSVKIEGNVFLRGGMLAEGEVCFAGASVGGHFQWNGVQSPEKSTLDLRFTRVGTLLNDQDSWPTGGNLYVGGLVYGQIDDLASPNADAQLGWLRRQPQKPFLSQPYEQLAAVLRQRGLKEDARKVMIEKNKDYARHLLWRPAWLWYGLFGKIIGYGYSPWRAFWISLIVIGIGWLVFQRGYDSKLVTPTGDKAYVVEKNGNRRLSKNGTPQVSEDYPKFNAFVYSVETFVPLLKLGIGERWIPNARLGTPLNVGMLGKIGFPRKTGSLLRYYLWCHIIAGWVLTTLWVGGLTGLVKT